MTAPTLHLRCAAPTLPAGAALPAVPAFIPVTAAQARLGLIVGRSLLGAIAWLTPSLASKLFGINTEENPAASYLGRLFAIREFALAAPLLTEDADVQQRSLQVGMVVDGADAVAAVLAGARGALPRRAAAMAFLAAVGALLLGWIASQPD